ncbi:hypothetical protein ACL02T_33100 [Pseudonocardia sp. RS010]|uniref:hypothetical protein n=1 Tax=Pseudonocardia sp. RS010 TaxID=3385979 RepID=UPI00399FC93D
MTIAPDQSLTGDPLTDELVPLVTALADAVYAGDAARTAEIRAHAEAVVSARGADPAEAGWALATVAAAMVPGGAHPRLLLAWRAIPALQEVDP